MAGFLIFGILLTILLAAGGGYLFWRADHVEPAETARRRHREEARQLQIRLDAEPDFTRHFHHPTQNELLETLQALDHLTPGWDQDGDTLTDTRFKNELAESFPTLRRADCVYPHPIASDIAHGFDQSELSPEALEESLQRYAQQQAERRAAFHAERAQANAKHQMATGPDVGPVTLAPGSLPFRVTSETRRRRPAWAARLAFVAVAVAAMGTAAYLYAKAHPELLAQGPAGDRAQVQPGQDLRNATVPAITPPPAATPVLTPTPAKLAGGDGNGSTGNGQDGSTAPASPAATVAASNLPPTPTPNSQADLAQRVAESKLRAVEKHPDLAVAGSEINTRFVFRYKNMLEDHSPRLREPTWPETLADECAAAAAGNPKPRKTGQTTPKRG